MSQVPVTTARYQKMGKVFVTILRSLLPMMAQTVLIYTLLLIGDWVTIYYLDQRNPLLIFAYLSLIHIATVPLLKLALDGNTKFYIIYAALNGLWILATIILMFIISFDALGRWSLILLQGNPLHHIFLLIFFIVNVVSEVIVILLIIQSKKSVAPEA